jgi:hypothetical protein
MAVMGLREDDTLVEQEAKTACERGSEPLEVFRPPLVDAQKQHEARPRFLAKRRNSGT